MTDISSVWAYVVSMTDPERYYSHQVPNAPLTGAVMPPQGLSLTLQMGNTLLLLAFMALICCWTKHTEITKYYLIAVAIADIGHIYAAYAALGDTFWKPSEWNDMIWGNIGASVFLNINRWLTVLDLFGKVGEASATGQKKGA